MFTIYAALSAARKRIEPASSSASLDAQVLLGAVMNVERAYLLAHPELPLSDDQRALFEAMVERCEQGEPIAYILGRRAFYDRELLVTPDVLVPRPETELLLEAALAFAGGKESFTAADIGTGSGALAVTFAALTPAAQVHAVDISPAALAVAQRNARIHTVHERITFYEGDLLRPLLAAEIRLDLLMANLPYVASGELPHLAVTRYEPHLALDGGVDGLDLVRRLLDDAPTLCNAGALILLEIGAAQGIIAQEAAQAAFPSGTVSILPDYVGLDRIVKIIT